MTDKLPIQRRHGAIPPPGPQRETKKDVSFSEAMGRIGSDIASRYKKVQSRAKEKGHIASSLILLEALGPSRLLKLRRFSARMMTRGMPKPQQERIKELSKYESMWRPVEKRGARIETVAPSEMPLASRKRVLPKPEDVSGVPIPKITRTERIITGKKPPPTPKDAMKKVSPRKTLTAGGEIYSKEAIGAWIRGKSVSALININKSISELFKLKSEDFK